MKTCSAGNGTSRVGARALMGKSRARTMDAGRFARLMEIGGDPLGERDLRETRPRDDEEERLPERRQDDRAEADPSKKEDEKGAVLPGGETSLRGEGKLDSVATTEGARGATRGEVAQQDLSAMAEQMLRSVQVQKLPNGMTALALRVESGSFEGVDIDLRLEAGKVRATFGVAEGGTYRLLQGKMPQLEQAFSTRGVVAHPVKVDLRSDRRKKAAPKKTSRRRALKGSRRGTPGRLM